MKPTQSFSLVYEDQNIIAVNKASGIAVSGDRWDDSAQRLDKLVAGSLSPEIRLFRVHRIDRDTSGLVVFAKNSDSHSFLSGLFEKRSVYKRYIAIVNGRPLWKEEACDLPLVPDGNKKHQTIIDKFQGKKSFTRFRVLCSAGTYSVLEVLPETGRTHQIRVHAAALGFPVVCDSLYGSEKPVYLSSFKRKWRGDPLEEKPLLARLGLHAEKLHIPAAKSSEAEVDRRIAVPGLWADGLKLKAAIARDMAALINQMEKN